MISTMTRLHFEAIARMITTLDTPLRFNVAVHFANELKKHNPKFNRGRFLEACKANDIS
jgi:hypothetical protein